MIRKAIQRHSGQSLTEGPIWIALVRLSVPIILANILQSAYQLTDTFWVGRLPAVPLRWPRFRFRFRSTFCAFRWRADCRSRARCSSRNIAARGRASRQPRGRANVALCACCLAVVGGGRVCLARPVMRFMGAAPDVLPDAIRFHASHVSGFRVRVRVFRISGADARLGTVYPPMFIVLRTVILNFIFDPFFIFGFGPVPAMGVAGAAMATLCTQAAATASAWCCCSGNAARCHLHWRDFRPDWRLMGTLFKIGAPSSVEQSTQALGMTLMMLLVSTFGTDPIAAYGVGTRVLSVRHYPGHGFVAGHVHVSRPKHRRRQDGSGRADQRNQFAVQFFGRCWPRDCSFFSLARDMIGTSHAQGGRGHRRKRHAHSHLGDCFPFRRPAASADRHASRRRRYRGADAAGDCFAVDSCVFRWAMCFRSTRARTQGIWWAVSISIIVSAILTASGICAATGKTRRSLLDEVRLEDSAERQMAMEEGLPF